MKHIIEITIYPKKSEAVLTRWHVWQDIIYPEIRDLWEGWRNAGDLFSRYGRPAGDIPNTYTAELLRPDYTPDMPNNRIAYSGYDGNPHAFKYRGQDIGEVRAIIHPAGKWVHMPKDQVFIESGYSSSMTPSANKFLLESVGPALSEYVKNHKTELRSDALNLLENRFMEQIREARKRIENYEIEALEALRRVKSK